VSILNHGLADKLGLGAMSPEAAAALFAGQDLPNGSRAIKFRHLNLALRRYRR